MDRRSAIKNITLSFGTITLSTGILSMIQSCQTNSTDWSSKFFSLAQIIFLDRILEIIIPETDSPGAKSLKLVRFVDAYLYKNFRTAEQEFVLSTMQDFMNMILESENISSVSDIDDPIIEKYFSLHIDNENIIAQDGNNYSQICGLFREMAVRSYKLTEYVLTNKLGYVPIPGYYDGNVDI
jgi:hypothetical protein